MNWYRTPKRRGHPVYGLPREYATQEIAARVFGKPQGVRRVFVGRGGVARRQRTSLVTIGGMASKAASRRLRA